MNVRSVALLGLAALLPAGVGVAGGEPLSDAEAREVLAALNGSSSETARAAIQRVVEARDRRFVAVFIELIFAAQMDIAAHGVALRAADGLERLTGESFRVDWHQWVRWYAGTDLAPPPGFVDFKGRLFARIDPQFERLLRDEHPTRIRPEEIVWGGVPYEGIPALDRPRVIPAAEATYLDPGEPVFGIRIGDEARAYPQRILDWHEMANDELGGIPISLAYCTLCGSGIAYDTRIPGDGPLDFGSSGLLMRSNKLMVDRQTRTLWNQFTGQPVLGPLADREIRLRVVPSVVATWGAWRTRHPDTTVLALDTGFRRPYDLGAAYAGYFASPTTMFPVRRAGKELRDKDRVFGVERDGVARAYPLAILLDRRVVNDGVADELIVLVAGGRRIWVDGVSVRTGPARYEAGAEVRAFRRGPHEFRPGEHPDELIDETGCSWSLEEDGLIGPAGERLPRTAGVLAYWFGWRSFHPRTEVYEAPEAKTRRDPAVQPGQ